MRYIPEINSFLSGLICGMHIAGVKPEVKVREKLLPVAVLQNLFELRAYFTFL